MALDYDKINADAEKHAVAVTTIYSEALDSGNFDEPDRIVARIIRDIIAESKIDKGMVPRFRALLKAMSAFIYSAHEAMDMNTLEEKLMPLKRYGLKLAMEAEGWEMSLLSEEEEECEEPFD